VKLAEHTILYFVGIGGIGMSALARYFHQCGHRVEGYDRSSSALTRSLEEEGIAVHLQADPGRLDQLSQKGELLVVYTPAIPQDFPELQRARALSLPLHKRSEVLGALCEDRYTVAVAGSHGKTTVSTLIAHILEHSGRGCTAFLGGISANYGSNLLNSQDDLVVVEADEYDRSFLRLEPDIAVVTALDADHLDVYGTREAMAEAFATFVGQIHPHGHLIARWGLEVHEYFPGRSISYDLHQRSADRHCLEIQCSEQGSEFVINRSSRRFRLGWPGLHNVENALAAICASELLGIPEDQIAAALEQFRGIQRRFEYRLNTPRHILIDDYAHHPEELSRLMESVRRIHGRKPVVLLFQPHLFSRTRDLGDAFAAALSKADRVLLLPIYPAREEPIAGIDSSWLAELIRKRPEQRPVELLDRESAVETILEMAPSLLLTAGAGDIDRLIDPLQRGLLTLSQD
jgi:UDP-N-acetylmuramate--alanine ligase